MSARYGIVAVFLGLLALTPACGNASPSPQAFRRDGSRICSKYGREAEAITMPEGRMGPYLSKTIVVLGQMHRAFGKLDPPLQDKRRFRAFLRLQARSLGNMKRLRRYVAVNEPTAYSALKRQKPRLHITPAQALEHPTGATLVEAMSIPAFGRYVRGLERLGRSFEQTAKKGERVTKQLGFTGCL